MESKLRAARRVSLRPKILSNRSKNMELVGVFPAIVYAMRASRTLCLLMPRSVAGRVAANVEPDLVAGSFAKLQSRNSKSSITGQIMEAHDLAFSGRGCREP
jgi:hypothetical protein